MDKQRSGILLKILWIFSWGVSVVVPENDSSRTYSGRFSPGATFMQSMFQTNMFQPSPNFMFRGSSINNVDNDTKSGNTTSLTPNLGNTHNSLGQRKSDGAQNGFVGLPMVPGSAKKQGDSSHIKYNFPDSMFEMIKPYEARQTSWQKELPTEKLPLDYNNNGLYGQVLINQYPLQNSPVQNNSRHPVFQPIFNGEPGMLGTGEQSRDNFENKFSNLQRQTTQGVKNISTIPEPVYSGFPGMLGAISMVQQGHEITQNSNDTFNTVHQDNNTGQDAESNATRTNGIDENGINVNSNPVLQMSNMLNGILPNLNGNNWNGDWPGQPSETDSATGNWAKGWTHNSRGSKDGDEKLDPGNPIPDNGIKASSWDGSWPDGTNNHHQTNGERKYDMPFKYGNIRESLDTLKNLLAKLDDIKSGDDNRISDGGSRSYSDMVGNWAKDIRS